MNFLYLLACALVLSLAGCGKKSGPVGSDGATTTTNLNAATAAVPAHSPAIVAGSPPPEVDLLQLTREVRKWIVRNQRPPKSFEDFAATTTAAIPPPPPQKKYAITKEMRVILVNR